MARPKIVLSISDQDLRILKKGRQDALDGVDLIEARIDRFKQFNPDYVLGILEEIRRFKLPTIGTIRKKDEGGSFSLDERKRFELFKSILPLVDIIDIELSSSNNPLWKNLIERSYRMKKKIIISYHNLKKTPENHILERIIIKAERLGADIIKIACFARKIYNVQKLLELTIKHSKRIPLVSLSLGRVGSISRIAFPLAGSIFTYTYIDRQFAPGQIPLKMLKEEIKRYYLT